MRLFSCSANENENLTSLFVEILDGRHQIGKPLSFPPSTMLVHPFVPADLLAFNAVNLDYYTETVSRSEERERERRIEWRSSLV